MLSGRNGSVADNRERASSRRKHRLKLNAVRKAESEERRRAEEVWAQHQAVLDRIENPPVPEPRIRRL